MAFGELQSAKILLVPPKMKNIFWYYTKILFSIAHCKVIALNLLCFIYDGISSLLIFLIANSKVIERRNRKDSLLFANTFKSVTER